MFLEHGFERLQELTLSYGVGVALGRVGVRKHLQIEDRAGAGINAANRWVELITPQTRPATKVPCSGFRYSGGTYEARPTTQLSSSGSASETPLSTTTHDRKLFEPFTGRGEHRQLVRVEEGGADDPQNRHFCDRADAHYVGQGVHVVDRSAFSLKDEAQRRVAARVDAYLAFFAGFEQIFDQGRWSFSSPKSNSLTRVRKPLPQRGLCRRMSLEAWPPRRSSGVTGSIASTVDSSLTSF